ncbi:MAG TPA: HD domain-containing protein [Nitrososphaeraceae archaeon]|nr:HD domain-containing protein [Nitrososphaeraceae archaeon]
MKNNSHQKKLDIAEEFLEYVFGLKSVKRTGWVSKVHVNNPESVADHTFSMCVISMVMSDLLGLDTEKVMKMVMLHDLAESITGDYMPEEITKKRKLSEEKKAMHSILGLLPSNIRSNYAKIWEEYISNRTDVARFVHRTDKIDMMIQAKIYSKQGYSLNLLSPFSYSADKSLLDI